MPRPCALLLGLLLLSPTLQAQSSTSSPVEIYAGGAYLSNSLNGIPGHRSPLLGWEAGVASPETHHVRFLVDVSHFSGTNFGASQHAIFIMGGAQIEQTWKRESVFAHALFGDGGLNRYWGPQAHAGESASFAVRLGGGLDTALNRHVAIRLSADMQHTNFALIESTQFTYPYRVPGMPTYFGQFSAGLVWKPVVRAAQDRALSDSGPPESEVIFESMNPFGHLHIFANSWWSYLHVAGVEYDCHSWGRAIGARLDYVAEVLPIVTLTQPVKTDVWGNKNSKDFKTFPGLGISPVGLRMQWRDGGRWKPFYLVKGGMIAFTQKSLSNNAAYENFSLQQSIGIQWQLTHDWDLRTGIEHFHFSNAFVVPSNPGLDDMMFTVGLSRRFHTHRDI